MNPKRLKKTEDEYKRLTGLYEDGVISKRDYSRALKKMALLDVQGNYWMIGAESGEWYRYKKGEWIKDDPLQRLDDIKKRNIKYRPAHIFSVLSLIIANLMPLLGMVYFQWELSNIIFLFWLENLVIGGWNLAKMNKAEGKTIRSNFTVNDKPARNVKRGPMIGFFLMHYGMFTLVHGIFVLILFGFPEAGLSWVGISFLFLCGSHGISYYKNFLQGGEYLSTSYQDLFIRPYGRIIVLHFVVVLSGWWIMKKEGSSISLILLVVGKIIIDLFAHLRERKKLIRQPD